MPLRLLLAAVLVVAFSAAAAAPASAGTAQRTCVVKGSKTVAKNRFARVFTVRGRGDVAARLYGCLHSVNRRVRLDVASSDEYVSAQSFNAVKLNGRFVAWHHTAVDLSCKADCPPGYRPETAELRVANLRTKRIKAIDGTLGEGESLVVTRTGAIGWIQPGSPVSVRAADADGRRVLYAGDDIDGGSLGVAGSTLSWTAGGVRRSAPLR